MVAMLIAYILDCSVVEYTIDKLTDPNSALAKVTAALVADRYSTEFPPETTPARTPRQPT
jgi:hypothetical protein